MNRSRLIALAIWITTVPIFAQENSLHRSIIGMAIQQRAVKSKLKTVTFAEQLLITNLTEIYNITLGQDWFDRQVDFSIWNDALSDIQTYVKQHQPQDMNVLKQLINLNDKLIAVINSANERIFQPMKLNEKVANQVLITFSSVAQNARNAHIKATSAIIQDLAYKIFIAANTGPDFFHAAYQGIEKLQ